MFLRLFFIFRFSYSLSGILQICMFIKRITLPLASEIMTSQNIAQCLKQRNIIYPWNYKFISLPLPLLSHLCAYAWQLSTTCYKSLAWVSRYKFLWCISHDSWIRDKRILRSKLQQTFSNTLKTLGPQSGYTKNPCSKRPLLHNLDTLKTFGL